MKRLVAALLLAAGTALGQEAMDQAPCRMDGADCPGTYAGTPAPTGAAANDVAVFLGSPLRLSYLTAGSASQVLRVNAAGTALEWVTPGYTTVPPPASATLGCVGIFLGSPLNLQCDAPVYTVATKTLSVPYGTVAASNLVATALATPGSVTVTPQGTGGAVTWTYKLVARLGDGTTTEAGAASSTTVGNATLDGTNFNRLTWSAVTGAVSYDVYRTAVGTTPATTGKIASALAALTLDDTALAGGGETAPTTNGTGVATVAKVSIASAGTVRWSTDAGLVRSGAGVLKATDGAAGNGSFLADGSSNSLGRASLNGGYFHVGNYNSLGQTADGTIKGDSSAAFAWASGAISTAADTSFTRAAAGLPKSNGGIMLSTGARPTCDATKRGAVWYVAGGAGVADTIEICGKAAADSYSWVALATF